MGGGAVLPQNLEVANVGGDDNGDELFDPRFYHLYEISIDLVDGGNLPFNNPQHDNNGVSQENDHVNDQVVPDMDDQVVTDINYQDPRYRVDDDVSFYIQEEEDDEEQEEMPPEEVVPYE